MIQRRIQCTQGNEINSFSFSSIEILPTSHIWLFVKDDKFYYFIKKWGTYHLARANNTSSSSLQYSFPSQVEGITLSVVFLLEAVLTVAGNFLTIGLFAKEKKLRKKSLFLVVNMAFADLMSGAVSLRLYVYTSIGPSYRLWKTSYNALDIGWDVTDTTFSQESLISAVVLAFERFYAIYWPLKHRTLSTKAYYITIFIIWTLALLVSAVFNRVRYLISYKAATHAWMSFPLLFLFIVCGCNIGICRTFHKRKVSSQQGNRVSQTQRLTATFSLVSTTSIVSWLSLVTANYIFYVQNITTPKKRLIYDIINILNYSNCFVNSVVYSLRILEFRQALVFCLTRRRTVIDKEGPEAILGNVGLSSSSSLSLLLSLHYCCNEIGSSAFRLG